MKKKTVIKAVIIDDEPGCVSYLSMLLNELCPEIKIVATGNSNIDLLSIINETDFDIAFLDIQLVSENIFDITDSLENQKFKIVFVTAFDTYALQAIKIAAIDYILKPLQQDEILNCYKRILKAYNLNPEHAEVHPEDAKILVRQGDKCLFISQGDILYLKARGSYTDIIFYMAGQIKTMTLCKPLGILEEEYNKRLFYRIHKSFLINVKKVLNVIKTDIYNIKMINGEMIPVAQRRVKEFLSFIRQPDEIL